jgi:hypothetical protein
MFGIGTLNIFLSISNPVRLRQNFGISGGGGGLNTPKPPLQYVTVVKPFGRTPDSIWKQWLRGNFMDLMKDEKYLLFTSPAGR